MTTKGNRPKISFPPETLNRIQEECKRTGFSLAEVVRRAVDDWFVFRDIRLASQSAAPEQASTASSSTTREAAPPPPRAEPPRPAQEAAPPLPTTSPVHQFTQDKPVNTHERPARNHRNTKRPTGPASAPSGYQAPTASADPPARRSVFDELDLGEGPGAAADPYEFEPPPGVRYVRADELDEPPVAPLSSSLFEKMQAQEAASASSADPIE